MILVLAETKCENESRLFSLKKLGYDGLSVSPSVGRSGGIATVWWKDRIFVTKIRRERQFLHFHCVLDGYAPFFYTTFYAVPQSNLKRILWEELKALSNMISNPWAIIGDFNDILLSLEKVGGTSSSDERIKLFHDRL
ncbi:hypothetical protein K1719_046498 [Acacia pycnantha]|nr:hypothetical protein K1719_046498 [Acacia pycnantha]